MEWPVNNKDILHAVEKAFHGGKWWIYKGKEVYDFEKRFADFHGSKYGISVCNGTVPLEIVLRALDIGSGDAVVLPAYNYYSLPKSVSKTGATPLFVDIHEDSLSMNAEEVRSVLNDKVKAVVAVHLCGALAKIDELRDICSERNIYLIEDCAQSSGSVYDGKRAGSFGTAGIFSFGGVKLMTCGQGGMIITSDKELYEKCYAIVNRGYIPGVYGEERRLNPYGIIGENYQMSELSAVILGPQLDILDELCRKREEIMKFLDGALEEVKDIKILRQYEKTLYRSQMRYAFYYNGPMGRENFIKEAVKSGIPLISGYSSISNDAQQFRVYASDKDYPFSAKAHEEIVLIHHTEILKGIDYWNEAAEKLKNFR